MNHPGHFRDFYNHACSKYNDNDDDKYGAPPSEEGRKRRTTARLVVRPWGKSYVARGTEESATSPQGDASVPSACWKASRSGNEGHEYLQGIRQAPKGSRQKDLQGMADLLSASPFFAHKGAVRSRGCCNCLHAEREYKKEAGT